jgi:hypothetical protein
MKSGKIIAITPNGEYTNKFGKLTKKNLVTFADASQYTFGSIGDFKPQVGEEIKYEITSEQYKNAKLVIENNFTPSPKKSLDTNQSILRQVAFKGAIELAVAGKIELDKIQATTEYFYTKILN